MSERFDASRDAPLDDGVGTTRARYDWSETTATTAVVETLARNLDRDPTDIAPLGGSVDPDALNSLVRSTAANREEVSVSFALGDRRVFLNNRGHVVVEDRTDTV